MPEDIIVNDITTDFITAAHLTEVKRQYYELDMLNEFSGERYVFMIPKQIFLVTIMNRTVITPKVINVLDRKNNKKSHPMTI